jgi:hypothetical protein
MGVILTFEAVFMCKNYLMSWKIVRDYPEKRPDGVLNCDTRAASTTE